MYVCMCTCARVDCVLKSKASTIEAYWWALSTASANQNVGNNILLERPEKWLPYWTHKLKHSNWAEDWWIPDKNL